MTDPVGVDRRQAAAWQSAYRRESAGDVHRVVSAGERRHRVVRGWIPIGGTRRGAVDGREVPSRLSADGGEDAADVERLSGGHHRSHCASQVSVPRDRCARLRIEGGESRPSGAPDDRERTRRVDRVTRYGERVDPVAVGDWIPFPVNGAIGEHMRKVSPRNATNPAEGASDVPAAVAVRGHR